MPRRGDAWAAFGMMWLVCTLAVGSIMAVAFQPYYPSTPADALPTYYHKWPDAHYLVHQADAAGLPRALVLAVAWTESRTNLNPKLRGHHCHAQANCEVGRYQIKPATAALRCPGFDIRRYSGNVGCWLQMAAEDYADGGTERVLKRQIGTGLGTAYQQAYLEKVYGVIGRLAVAK